VARKFGQVRGRYRAANADANGESGTRLTRGLGLNLSPDAPCPVAAASLVFLMCRGRYALSAIPG